MPRTVRIIRRARQSGSDSATLCIGRTDPPLTTDPTTLHPADRRRPWSEPVLAGLVLVSLWGLFLFTAQSGNAFTTYLIPLVLLGSRTWRRELALLLHDPLYVGILVLLGYLGTSAAWSASATPNDVAKALSRIVFIVGYVSALVLLERRYHEHLRVTLLGVVAAAAASAVLAAAFGLVEEGRLIGYGDLDRAVVAGLCWGAACALALAVSIASTGAARAVAIVCAVATFAAMIASDSRTAWLAFAASLVVLAATHRRPGFSGLIVVAVAAFGVVVATDAGWLAWWFPRGDSFRFFIWASTLETVLDGPWLHGFGMLENHAASAGPYLIPHPHSVYLATLFHGGVVGLALLIGVLAGAVVRCIHCLADPRARTALVLLAFASVALALDGKQLIDKVGWLWLLLWTPLAWAIASGRRIAGR